MKAIIILLLSVVCYLPAKSGNVNDSITVKKKIPYYHNMISSFSISSIKPQFLAKDFQTYHWNNYDFQYKWFEFSYGYGKVNTIPGNTEAQLNIHDTKIGVNWTFKKLVRGNRALDVKGFLFVPSLSANLTQMKVWKSNETRIRGIKIAPVLSFQFPFVGIDAKFNFDFRQNKSASVKPFSMYLEICLKFDALFHILDPKEIYVGRYKNSQILVTETEISRNYDGSRKVQYDYYKLTTEFDRNAKSIGVLSGFGPRYTYKNFNYAGSTHLFGIGYFLRAGALGFDAFADFGQLGFASETNHHVTYSETKNKRSSSFDTDKFLKSASISNGYFNAKRIGASLSMDVLQIMPLGNEGGKSANTPTGMVRLLLGLGGGFTTISSPHYNSEAGLEASNQQFNANFDWAPVSENHARYSKNSGFFSINAGLELGVIQIKLEHCYYNRAYLASLSSITIGYILPFKRINEKLKEVKE